MKPRAKMEPNGELFREELAQLIDLNHPLCVMADQLNWEAADEIILGWFEAEGGSPSESNALDCGAIFPETDVQCW